jgi:hypothetical protein
MQNKKCVWNEIYLLLVVEPLLQSEDVAYRILVALKGAGPSAWVQCITMQLNQCYRKFLRLTSDKLGPIFTCGGKAGVCGCASAIAAKYIKFLWSWAWYLRHQNHHTTINENLCKVPTLTQTPKGTCRDILKVTYSAMSLSEICFLHRNAWISTQPST